MFWLEAAGEIWYWSLLGVKRLNSQAGDTHTQHFRQDKPTILNDHQLFDVLPVASLVRQDTLLHGAITDCPICMWCMLRASASWGGAGARTIHSWQGLHPFLHLLLGPAKTWSEWSCDSKTVFRLAGPIVIIIIVIIIIINNIIIIIIISNYYQYYYHYYCCTASEAAVHISYTGKILICLTASICN